MFANVLSLAEVADLEAQTFTLDKEMKDYLSNLKKNNVNVSKFIRDAISDKMVIKKDKRRKPTIDDLRKSLENIF